MSDAPLPEAQFSELLRVIRETVRAEVRAEFEAHTRVKLARDRAEAEVAAQFIRAARETGTAWQSEGMVI